MEVTLQLPDQLYEQAKQWAAITQQDLNTALTDALSVILTPIHVDPELDKPIASLSDQELLKQVEIEMAPEQGQRLNRLMEQQRDGTISEDEHRELYSLFHLYQRLWLRQSEALAEAVSRDLRAPMHP